MKQLTFVLTLAFALAGCNEQETASQVSPVTMTHEAVGHYCQMNVLDHEGPKAQVHLEGTQFPIWFVQIRDAFAFERMPEQSARIAAIYVNDMGAPGATWNAPGKDNWIKATDAIYVVGSNRRGGMGAPDLIPFANEKDALVFVQLHGGSAIPFAEIKDSDVLAPVEVELDEETHPSERNGS